MLLKMINLAMMVTRTKELMMLSMLLVMLLNMMHMVVTRTKELMMLHGKLKQSEAKYSAIRDLMAGM